MRFALAVLLGLALLIPFLVLAGLAELAWLGGDDRFFARLVYWMQRRCDT